MNDLRFAFRQLAKNPAVLALIAMPLSTFGAEPGTIGVAVNQLYSELQPTKRGAFIVRQVESSSAAANAGIQPGDRWKPVFGADSNEMVNQRLAGPAGSSIEISVVQADGAQKKITLLR